MQNGESQTFVGILSIGVVVAAFEFGLLEGSYSFVLLFSQAGEGSLWVGLSAMPFLAIGIIATAKVMSVIPLSVLGRRASQASFRKTDWKGCLRLGTSVLAINLPWLLVTAARTDDLMDNVEAIEGGPLLLAALHAVLFLLALLISARCIVTVFGLQYFADASDLSAPPSAP